MPIDGDIQTEYDHLLNTYDFAFNDDHNAGLRWPIVMNVNKDRKIDMYPVDKTCQELGAFAASILASTPGLAAYKEAVVKRWVYIFLCLTLCHFPNSALCLVSDALQFNSHHL